MHTVPLPPPGRTVHGCGVFTPPPPCPTRQGISRAHGCSHHNPQSPPGRTVPRLPGVHTVTFPPPRQDCPRAAGCSHCPLFAPTMGRTGTAETRTGNRVLGSQMSLRVVTFAPPGAADTLSYWLVIVKGPLPPTPVL